MKKIDKIKVWITKIRRWWNRLWFYDSYLNQPLHWNIGVNDIFHFLSSDVQSFYYRTEEYENTTLIYSKRDIHE